VHPGEEVCRFQESLSAAGWSLEIATMLEAAPLAQSAELQMRRSPEAMTTDTNFALMLNRHGWLALETACTVKLGVVPA
jgi:hypothetical protein